MTEKAEPVVRHAPLVRASVALHGAALAAVVAQPQLWPWALGAIAADHLALTAAGLVPRSKLLGANWTRLPSGRATTCVALTIDDGPDPSVTPRVLELLARRQAVASFFCIGERVAAHPALAREIVAAGHRVENHSQRHRHDFSLLGPAALRAEIGQAQDTIASVTGRLPRFFRAPAGLRNPFLDPVLQRLSLTLATWTRRGFDTVRRDPAQVRARLERRLGAGDILLLHDGHAARTAGGVPVILEVLPALLASLEAAGLRTVSLASCLPRQLQ